MANLELPMAMLCLSSLSQHPAVVRGASQGVLPHETNLKDPQIRGIYKVLDGIVYFLPVIKGLEFALSMEIGESVRIAIAGNNEDHYDKAFGRTPAETVQYIWSALSSIAASDPGTASSPHVEALLECLLERQEAKMKARFAKRREQCERFFELANNPEWRATLTQEQNNYLNAAKNIFLHTSTLFGYPPEVRKTMYGAFLRRLEQARFDGNNLNKKGIRPYSWYDLESTVKERLGLPKRFDLVHYVDKLSAPSVHISRLLQAAQSRKFQEIFRLPLEVFHVATYPAPSNPLKLPSDLEIRSFLAHCYGEPAPEDGPIVLEVLDSKSKEVLSAIEDRSNLDIDAPHCECTLAHYHLSHLDSKPFPYIAVCKSSLSCLTCGLYLAASGKYREREGENIRFQNRGCRTDLTPLVALPSGDTTAELDNIVGKEISSVVEKIVGIVLRELVHSERMRRSRARSPDLVLYVASKEASDAMYFPGIQS